jgi:hypothetical protein
MHCLHTSVGKASDQGARYSGQVWPDGPHIQFRCLHQGRDGVRLSDPEFHDQPPAGPQKSRRGRRNRPIDIEAIRAAIQSKPRVEIAHLGIERCDCRAGDVGRVRNHKIEPAADRVRHVSGHEDATRGELVAFRVGAGNCNCTFAYVRCRTKSIWTFLQ